MTLTNAASTIILVAILAATSFSLLSPFDSASHEPKVQVSENSTSNDSELHVRPGANARSAGTLGLFFTDPEDGTLYASAAGHAVDYVGQEIRLLQPPNVLVGTVAAFHSITGDPPEDWALIEIDPNAPATPSISHWGGPTGMPQKGSIHIDDTVCHYGWGSLYQFAEESRHRCGNLAYFRADNDNGTYAARGTAWSGDSGSPVIHYETGQAIGLLTRLEITLHHWGGMDVCTLLERFSVHGFDLELATAPYDPPPSDLTLPVPPIDPQAMLRGTETECF